MKIELAVHTPVSAVETIQPGKWVLYGKDNLYPQYLNELIDTTAIHGTLCKRIPVRISGKGTTGKLPSDMDEKEFNKECRQMDSDLYCQGGFFVLVKYNLDGSQIAKIKTLPFDTCRVQLDLDGNINGVWYSRNWKEQSKRMNKPRFYNLYSPLMVPLGEDQNQPDQIFHYFTGIRSGEVYPKPFYHGAINQIETERQIAMFDVNEILNGFFPSVIVDIVTEDNNGAETISVTDELNKQVAGSKNTGKFLVLERPAGVEKSQVTTFEPNDMPQRYEQKIKSITQTLFVAHGITSPLLFGVRGEGGGLGSNKDEMKQAEELFMFHVIQPYQEIRLEALTQIMQFRDEVAPVYTIEQNSPISFDAPVALEKKKPQLSNDNALALIEWLSDVGLEQNPDWIEIDAHEVDYDEESQIELAQVSTGKARPNSESSQDKVINDVLYIARYRYSGGVTGDTRPFCKKMIDAGKLYRKEDIMDMGSQGVNPGWGPRGVDNYSVWLYKGGGNCHHVWEKVIFVSAKGLGIDVNSPKAKESAAEKAAAKGFKPRNQYKVSQRPIDMPNRGFLPKP